MKYIIDIPNADVSRWVGVTPLGKKLYVPISVEDGNEYNIGTGIYVEEYTEPDRKAIDLQHAHDIENVARMNYSKGAEDAWEFVNTLYGLSDEELYEIFDDGNYCEHSYQEAKAKYEEWKKQKVEIRVGDEVEYYCGKNIRFVVCGIYKGIAYGFKYCTGFGCLDMGDYCKIDELKKTGRHYDGVEKLLEEMREESE